MSYIGWLFLLAGLLAPSITGVKPRPYLQDMNAESVSVVWWSTADRPGTLEWGRTERYGSHIIAKPTLAMSVLTNTGSALYRHEARITQLCADTSYCYCVTQGNESSCARFVTGPELETDFSFTVAADPESKSGDQRRSDTHRAVLNLIRMDNPRFLVYAGDLVDQGNAQDDWNLFWSDLLSGGFASNIPIYAALGNHDYDGLNTTLGGNRVPYAQPYSEFGVAKFLEYFTFPDNPTIDSQKERYYSFSCGPVTIIVLDTNNDSISTNQPDTNWDTGRYAEHPLVGEAESPEVGGQGGAPDIHLGSQQYSWLVGVLRRSESSFIFIVNHQAPYSSFVHGDPQDRQSGYPLRKLDALFHQYGVAAVFSGHDESYERSVTMDSDGRDVHYYVLPTVADSTGLRLPMPNPRWQQGYRRFIYPKELRRHGWLTVRIDHIGDRRRATIIPHYYNPTDPTNRDLHYNDIVRIIR